MVPSSTKSAISGTSVITASWALAVILCSFGQPFALGFYLDDWPECAAVAHAGAPFSRALLEYVYLIDPSRPGLLPLRFLFSSLFGDRPFLWHSALLFANCLVALILVGLIGLLGADKVETKATATWIGLCWLLLPWNSASQFWPTFLPNVIALVAFGLLCALLVRSWARHRHNAVLACMIYLWICLSYEAFYFQWVTLALLGLALIRVGRARLRQVVYSTTALIIAQMVAVLWHLYSKRLVSGGVVGVERPIVSDWPGILFGDLLTTIPSIFRSFGEARVPFAVIALLAGAAWLVNLYQSLRSSELRQATWTPITFACVAW